MERPGLGHRPVRRQEQRRRRWAGPDRLLVANEGSVPGAVQRIAVLGVPDRRRQHVRPADRAAPQLVQGVRQRLDGGGHRGQAMPDQVVRRRVRRRRRRRHGAAVQHHGIRTGPVHQHDRLAAEPRRRRLRHAQRKGHGHRGVHRVASRRQDLKARLCRLRRGGRDHPGRRCGVGGAAGRGCDQQCETRCAQGGHGVVVLPLESPAERLPQDPRWGRARQCGDA